MSETRHTIAAALLVAIVAALLFSLHPQFFLKDDFLLQFLPGSRDVARAWSEGSFPLLSPYSWNGGALGAEYQFGVFSIACTLLDILTWLLPLPILGRAAFLYIAYAVIAGTGAYRLARSYGARPAYSMLAALVASLNGWNLWWGTTWFAAMAGFAWIPWYWLALRGVLRGTSRWSWLGVAVTAYLVIAAGSPYVTVMAPLIAAMSFFTAVLTGKRREAWVMTGASILGLLLAAPAVLMLFEYSRYGSRMAKQPAFGSMWTVPVEALFGFVVPAYNALWPVFGKILPHRAVELLGAFIPLAAILGAGRQFLRRMLPEVGLAVLVLVLAILPSRAPLQWSFHWLPLFFLALGVLGACALESNRKAWGWAAGLALLAMLAAAVFGGDAHTVATHGALLIVACLVWALLARRSHGEAMPVLVTIVAMVATFASFSHTGYVPIFEDHDVLRNSAPFDPTRRYLAMYDSAELFHEDAYGRWNRGVNLAMRPGNTPMIPGLHFINGYSPVGFDGLANIFVFELHGTMPPDRTDVILQRESGPNQLLHHLGVDGIIVPEPLAMRNAPLLAHNGWTPAGRAGDSILLHRRERLQSPLFQAALAIGVPDDGEGFRAIEERAIPQLPVVLLTPGASGVHRYGHRNLTNMQETRHATSFDVDGKGPRALVVFRRPWFPGLHATLDGRPLPVLRADMVMPAIELPGDAHGHVRLWYRPISLVIGLTLAVSALAIIGLLSIRIRRSWPLRT